jgi:hypothetical protein
MVEKIGVEVQGAWRMGEERFRPWSLLGCVLKCFVRDQKTWPHCWSVYSTALQTEAESSSEVSKCGCLLSDLSDLSECSGAHSCHGENLKANSLQCR